MAWRGKKTSKVAIGFNRLGIVLCVLILFVCTFFASKEWFIPSGRYVTTIPEKAIAWAPDKEQANDVAIVELISEQLAAGIEAPKGFLVVGVPLQVEKRNNIDWTKFQLRDGREIGIASTDEKLVRDTAIDFLWQEKAQRRAFTDKDAIEIFGVRVIFLNVFDQFAPTGGPWPKQRQRDWTLSLFLVGLAIALYVLIRLVGWIIDGFIGSSERR